MCGRYMPLSPAFQSRLRISKSSVPLPTRSNPTAALTTELNSYNAGLRNDYAFADFLVDFAADARLADGNNTTYFVDGLHFTAAGNDVIAGIAQNALASVGVSAPAQIGPPTNTRQCRDNGWMNFNTPRAFKNQADCIQFINKGK